MSWTTNSGPQDLAGYRLDRRVGVEEWLTIAPLIRGSSYHDVRGSAGSRYRLFGINGLGGEVLLGEAQFLSNALLAARPLPFRGGVLDIQFAVAGARGGGAGRAEVALYDARGRLVRTIVQSRFPAGVETVSWDGLDQSGRAVSPGLYFLRSRSGGEESRLKIVVAR